MVTFLTIFHFFICVFLILVVLLQTGKGADVAAAFGGSSQTAFGARGAATLLSKLTTGSAIVFMITSFTLAMMASSGSGSVVKDEPGGAPVQQSAPATPPAPAPSQEPAPQTPPPAPQQ